VAKNKAKKANLRAQRANARSKDRAIARARDAAQFKTKKKDSFDHFVSNPVAGYEFWMLHGTNFLLSSFDSGLWSPIFPEAYAGKSVTRTEFFKRVLEKHMNQTTNQLSPDGTKAVLWASMKPKEMWDMVYRARKLAFSRGGDPVEQAQPDIWHFLHTVMGEFIRHLDAQKKTEEGRFSLPTEGYGPSLPEALASTVSGLSGISDPLLAGVTKALP
jgi:hypothetical protein